MKTINACCAAALTLAAPFTALAQAADGGLHAWARVHQVFSHPRCANCHVDAAAVPVWPNTT